MTTDPKRYHHIKSIFEQVVDIPSGSKRDAYLDEACLGDDNLRSEVESLLREYDTDDDFLETPAMGAGFAVNVDELQNDYSEEDAFSWLPEDRVIGGKYHIQSLLAIGGMGAVYEATQDNPSRTVALKVMRRGFAGRSIRRRFEYECEALAKLQHPHIAHLYDCGIHYLESVRKGGDGISYFVMEYIDNAKSITEWVQAHSLGTRERLHLFLDICEAIHHGHQRGIIHRDIKPGNILVGSDGEVKVIDFGVACMTNSDIAITTMHTDIGQLIGTVQYMSPEQCAGDINDIDMRSDIYSLGLVLYELLTDELPYDISGQSLVHAVKTVQEHSPKHFTTIHRSLRGDPETIVFKALAKEREARYQSVDEMARDITHYLNHEPITARPASRIYRTAKFVERYRWQTATVSAIVLILIISFVAVLTSRLAMRAARNETLAVSTAQGAKQNNALAAILASDSAGALRILDRIPEESRKWEWNHINSTVDQSAETIDPPENFPGKGWGDMDISEDGKLMAITTNEVVVIWNLRTRKQIKFIRRTNKLVKYFCAALSPDNKYLAIVSQLPREGATSPYQVDEYVHIIRLKDETTLAEKKLSAGDAKDILFLHQADGPPVLAVTYGNSDTVNYEIVLLKYQGENKTAPADTAKSRLVEIARLKGHTWSVYALALSRNGRYLASSSADLTARIWDVSKPEKARCVAVLRGHEYYVTDVSFSADDSMLATSSLDGSIKLWDVQKSIEEYARKGDENAAGVQTATLLGHQSGVTTVSFSPVAEYDGSWMLASGSTDNTVRLWEVKPRGEITQVVIISDGNGERYPGPWHNELWKAVIFHQVSTLRGQLTWIVKVRFLPDGSRIVSMSQDGAMKFWLPYPVETVPTLLGSKSSVFGVSFTPDGRYLVSTGGDHAVRIWNVNRAVEIFSMPTAVGNCTATVTNKSKVLAAVGSEDGTIFMWDITDPVKPIALPSLKGHRGSVNSVIFNREGSQLLSAGTEGTIRLWNISQPTAEPVVFKHAMSVGAAVYSPDERWIISGAGAGRTYQGIEGGTITVWDAMTHKRVRTFTEHEAGINSLAIKNEGDRTWLISTSQDKTAIIWDASDLPNLRVLHRLTGHTGAVLSSAIHPMENRVATGSRDCTIKIWDITTGAEMATLRGHIAAINDLAFSPDGKRLASTSVGHDGKDNSIKLWETKWDPELAELRRQAKIDLKRKRVEARKERKETLEKSQ